MSPVNLPLTCILCGQEIVGPYVTLKSHWAATAHPDCEKTATEARKAAAKPRPVHVEFWRCGATSRGRGRCLTAHLCQYHGCQKVEGSRSGASAGSDQSG